MLSIIHYLHEQCDGDAARRRGYWHGYCALVQHGQEFGRAPCTYALRRLNECYDAAICPWYDEAARTFGETSPESIYRCGYRNAYATGMEHITMLGADGKTLRAILEHFDTFTLEALHDWCHCRTSRPMPPPEPKAIHSLRRRLRR